MSSSPSRGRWVAVAGVVVGCGRHPQPTTPVGVDSLPAASIRVGACGAPERDGVMSDRPQLRRADRDLDGVGGLERVVADERMCTADGNCYWNVFIPGEPGGCERYVGTIAGRALEILDDRPNSSLATVRGYWELTGDGRMLVHEYEFRGGGYVLTETLLCKRTAGERISCTEDTR